MIAKSVFTIFSGMAYFYYFNKNGQDVAISANPNALGNNRPLTEDDYECEIFGSLNPRA